MISTVLLPSLLLLAPTWAARPMAGLAWVPFDRGDLTWILEERDSGTAVGEFDGILRPALTAHGGLRFEKCALILGVSMARLTTTTWTEESTTQSHQGALRLAADFRRGLPVGQGRVLPWLEAGVHGVIPSARSTSDAYTDAEQADADEGARGTRARIRMLGASLGPGLSYPLEGGLSLGLRARLVIDASWQTQETSVLLSTLVHPESALLLEAVF